MKLEIRWKGTERSVALGFHVESRARFAFRPARDRIRHVVVRLEDVNGPKGGIDKRCSVEVRGSFGICVAEARDTDFYVAANRALEMAGRSTVRAIERSTQRELRKSTRLWSGA